jgi:preprotein translocase subunit SecF
MGNRIITVVALVLLAGFSFHVLNSGMISNPLSVWWDTPSATQASQATGQGERRGARGPTPVEIA